MNTEPSNQTIPNTGDNKKVLACPKCRKKLRPRINKTKSGWACYVCGFKFPTPFLRTENYYSKVIILNGKPVRRKNKRKFTDNDLLKRKELVMSLTRYVADKYKIRRKDIRNAALIAFLFLTASRISEVLGIPARDAENKPIQGRFLVEPLRKYQIKKTLYPKYNKVLWTVERLPVLKRRGGLELLPDGRTVKNYPTRNIALIAEYEQDLIRYVDDWLRTIKDEEKPVFPIARQTAWNICYRFNQKYCHFWRHIRNSDLVLNYGFDSLRLKHFDGWASEAMAEKYVHLSTDTLIDTMMIGYKNRPQEITEHEQNNQEQDLTNENVS